MSGGGARFEKSWESLSGDLWRRWIQGCGDEEVRAVKRSAPPLISPVPERQSRPGQRRFRCQRETTDWQDQAGPLLLYPGLDLSSFLPSHSSLLPHDPSLPFLQPQPSSLCSLAVYHTAAPTPLSTPRRCPPPTSPSFSPLKLNISTGLHSAGQADWGGPQWSCVSSVLRHMFIYVPLISTNIWPRRLCHLSRAVSVFEGTVYLQFLQQPLTCTSFMM